jgi:GTP 3',8-cyclase
MSELNIDFHKLQYHPERVSEWKERGDCYPIYVEVGPTNGCNHRCIFCALDWMKHGVSYLKKDIMLSLLEDMSTKGVKSIMFAGEGEPFLHPDICLFINKAKKQGLDVSVTTNGVLFDKKKIEKCMSSLTWIRFSIDAGSAETYSKIHGTNKKDFKKLIENIKEAVKFKKKNRLKTTIGVQFLLMPQNFREASTFTKLFKEIGVDNVQIKPYSQHPNSINRVPVNFIEVYDCLGDELKKQESNDFKVFFRRETMERIDKGINYPECYGLPFFALIDSRGDIMPCNLFYNKKEFTYGNLYKDNFSKIWAGKKRQIVLNKLKKKGCKDCRKGCRLDAINRYLDRIKNPEEHDNFI